jgi:hypothetical protein
VHKFQEKTELNNKEKIQTRLESITRKWWFVLLLVLYVLIPASIERNYDPSKLGEITNYILFHALINSVEFLYPVFKVVPILLVLSIIFFKNRATRWFSVYAGISYVLFAFLQNIAVTEEYGLAIFFSNIVMFLIVAAFWFWEAFVQRNDFSLHKRPAWKYWVVPFAFLAFWAPVNLMTLLPDFNPIYLFTNPAGLVFCMMTPLFLGMLTIYHPRVNIATFRVTSIAGTIAGIMNILINFFMVPSVYWWNGVLHIPLAAISVYGLILSFRKLGSPIEE